MTQQGEPSFEAMLINYLLAVISQASNLAEQRRMPDFVPCRIRTAEAMLPYLPAGEHDCETTVYGCIVVLLPETDRLGVYIHECEILALRPNTKKQTFERRQKEQEG
jgi:hypothetical protein